MTSTEIKRQLMLRYKKDFISLSEIGRALGMGADKTRDLMSGVDFLPSGREKRYLISDIADRIAEMRRV